MALASGIRRLRVLMGVCAALVALMIVAAPANANTRVVTGGETRLEVNIANFVKLLGDGIFITPIEPARLEFGSNPAAIFPAAGTGVADAALRTATVPHQGGLHIAKDSIGRAIDATNVTLACVNAGTITLAGCHVLNTANNVLPNELAEVADFTFTDDNAGTVTVTGRALVTGPTALVLNTLFETQVFQAGMELGPIRSTFTY